MRSFADVSTSAAVGGRPAIARAPEERLRSCTPGGLMAMASFRAAPVANEIGTESSALGGGPPQARPPRSIDEIRRSDPVPCHEEEVARGQRLMLPIVLRGPRPTRVR